MIELLEKAAEYLRGQEQRKAKDFDALVKAVADGKGKPPTPAQLAEQLQDFGKTLQDLDEAVSYRQTRHELARQLATVPGLEKEQQTVGRQYQAELARFAELKTAHEQAAGPLLSRSYWLAGEIGKARACEEQLRTGYIGDLTQELASIEDARRQIHQAAEPILHSRDHHGRVLRLAADEDSKRHSISAEEIAAHQRTVNECDRALGELRAKLPALEAREAEIHQLMLQP